jgi:hypothetical protein
MLHVVFKPDIDCVRFFLASCICMIWNIKLAFIVVSMHLECVPVYCTFSLARAWLQLFTLVLATPIPCFMTGLKWIVVLYSDSLCYFYFIFEFIFSGCMDLQGQGALLSRVCRNVIQDIRARWRVGSSNSAMVDWVSNCNQFECNQYLYTENSSATRMAWELRGFPHWGTQSTV